MRRDIKCVFGRTHQDFGHHFAFVEFRCYLRVDLSLRNLCDAFYFEVFYIYRAFPYKYRDSSPPIVNTTRCCTIGGNISGIT